MGIQYECESIVSVVSYYYVRVRTYGGFVGWLSVSWWRFACNRVTSLSAFPADLEAVADHYLQGEAFTIQPSCMQSAYDNDLKLYLRSTNLCANSATSPLECRVFKVLIGMGCSATSSGFKNDFDGFFQTTLISSRQWMVKPISKVLDLWPDTVALNLHDKAQNDSRVVVFVLIEIEGGKTKALSPKIRLQQF